MRIGLMVGPERARYSTKVERMLRDAKWAEDNGLATVWVPQVPDEFDAMTAVALMAQATSRIEIGTAVVPLQSRHPIALVQQSLSTQLVAQGRSHAGGVGPSHHWIIEDMLGLPYDKPASTVNDYLDVLDAAMAGPGTIEVQNNSFRINNPMYVTDALRMQVMIAALGPVMLKIAGSRTDGTILWLADEKAIGSYIAPRINEAAAAAGVRRVVAGVPVTLCLPSEVEAAKARANRSAQREHDLAQLSRLLDKGDAPAWATSSPPATKRWCAAASVVRRAGTTDISVRVVPIGRHDSCSPRCSAPASSWHRWRRSPAESKVLLTRLRRSH
jgi:F420-dependent oxidoreductase-like protein